MEVIRSCLLVVVLAATCHGFSMFRNISHAPALSSIRDNFVQEVRTAAGELQQAAAHRTRATTGAISALGTLNADLLRNFLSNNINLWRFIGSGILSRELALRRMIFGNRGSRASFISPEDFPQLRNMHLYPVLVDQPTFLHINTIVPENNEVRRSHDSDNRIITFKTLPEGDLKTDTVQEAT